MGIATIITKSYCVVSRGRTPYEGSKQEILSQICRIKFDEANRLCFKFTCHKAVTLHSYSNDWTDEDKMKDAVKCVWNYLSDYGYRVYRDIGI